MGLERWGDVRVFKVKPHVRHPVVVKSTLFYGASLGALSWMPRIKGEPRPLIHATGACSLLSDVVQVQFVNAAWKAARSELDADLVRAPRARTISRTLRARLKSGLIESYHEGMLAYQIAVERRVYTGEKTYIAIAHGVARELRQCFGLTKNIHVIHHGVDATQFHPSAGETERTERERLRASWNVRADQLVLLFVGAFERKGLAVLIDALGKMERSVSDRVKLVAVGSGDREAFGERARRLGVGNRLVFTGHTREVEKLYRAADLFVIPTLYEPFGLVILEAMATGLPVLASRLAGASELIVAGENGALLEQPTSSDEIAREIAKLVASDGLRGKLGSAALRTATARSWDQVAEEYAEVIAPLLQGRR